MRAMKGGLHSQHKASGVLDETNFAQPIRYHRNRFRITLVNITYHTGKKTNSPEEGCSERHDYLTQ